MKYRLNVVAIIFLMLVLTACGGADTETDAFSVISTEPANNETGIEIDSAITIIMSAPTVLESIVPRRITLRDRNSGLDVEGSIEVDGNNIVFTPLKPLKNNTSYNLEIHPDFSPNKLDRAYSLTFKTVIAVDQKAPLLSATIPFNFATDVVINTGISANFNEPIKASSVIQSGLFEFDLDSNSAGAKVRSTLSPAGSTLTLSPSDDLMPNTEYMVVLTGITDEANNVMPASSWRFTTGEAADNIIPTIQQFSPENIVPITYGVTVEFSEDIDVSTLSTNQFSLSGGGLKVIGAIVYQNKVATFQIQENNGLLKPGFNYSVEIKNVRDLAGNLIEPFQWAFSTNPENQAPPEVVSVTWQNLANGSGVVKNSNAVIVFSESIIAEPSAMTLNNGVMGSFAYQDNKTLIFMPSELLEEQTPYTLTIKASLITDEDLKPLSADYLQEFKTGDETAPIINASSSFPESDSTNVAINADISVSFSEALSAEGMTDYIVVKSNANNVEGVISITGNELRFDPVNDFPQNTLIDVVIKQNAKDLAGNALGNSFSWSFTSGDTIAPEVQTISPENGEIGVIVTRKIIVSFLADELLNPATVNELTVVLLHKVTGEAVISEYDVSGNEITVTPVADLLEKTEYRINIKIGVADVSGRNINSPYTAQFTTEDKTPPVIKNRSPAIDEKNVSAGVHPQVVFSEEMLAENIHADAFYLENADREKIPAQLEVASSGAKLIPKVPLNEESVYTVYLKENLLDLFGNALVATQWRFTVGDFTAPKVDSVIPQTGTTNVDVEQVVSIAFNEPMDQTVTENAFSISPNISGALDWAGNILTFTPTDKYTEQQEYTLTLKTTTADESGNTLSSPYTFNFTVGDFTGPSVDSHTPVDGAIKVTTNQAVSFIFNEAMNQIATSSAFSISPTVSGSLAWEDNTLTFMPDANYTEQLQYTVTLNTDAVDVNDNALINIYSFAFTVGDFTPPNVIMVTPAIDATNVAVDQVIRFAFSEEMDKAATEAAFSISPAVAGVFTWQGNALTFTPDIYIEKQKYTVGLSSTAADENENTLIDPFSFSFTVGDFTGPTVMSTVPMSNKTNVAVDQTISLQFDEAMSQSLAEEAFSISPVVAGSFSWTDNVLKFIPSVAYAELQKYTVTLGITAKDDNANALNSPYSFEFTVGDFTPPVELAHSPVGDNVAINTSISISFNESIAPVTINATSFTIKEEGTFNVSSEGEFEVSGGSITFTPSEDLLSETSYVVNVGTDVTDLAGNPLSSAIEWSFTTGDFIGPEIGLTGPVNNASNVGVEQVVSIHFNELMDNDSTVSAFEIAPFLAGNVGLSGGVLRFTPTTPYQQQTTYEVIVKGTAKDIADNAMGGDYSFTFTVGDFLSPTVSNEVPEADAIDVSIRQSVSLTFDEPMALEATSSAFSITPEVDGDLTWAGNTLTFTPAVNYVEEQVYTVALSASATDDDENANPLLPYFFEFTVGDFTAPKVMTASPVSGTNISVNQSLSITFSENMNQTTTENAFSLSPNIAGTFSWTGNILTFDPVGDYSEQESYTVTVNTSATDEKNNALAEPFMFEFTIGDFTGPMIVGSTPAIDATNVTLMKTISITFSETMNQPVTGNAFSLSPSVAHSLSWSGNTLTFTPNEAYEEQQKYTVTVGIASADDDGNTLLSPYSFAFTTGDFEVPSVLNSTPADSAIKVAVNQVINITFDDVMDQTETENAFSLSPPTSGSFSWQENTLSFTVDPSYKEKESYTVALSTNAADDVGNTLISPYSFGFTVGDFTKPTVNSTTPLANATDVTVKQVVSLTFNEPMNQAITQNSFSISPDIDGAFSWLINTLTFTPTVNYIEQQQYTITLNTSAMDDAGNALASPFSFDFVVGDFTRPTVNDTTPELDARDVAVNQTVSFTFDEPMKLAETKNAFSLSPEVDGDLSWQGSTLTFTPSVDYVEKQNYTATLSSFAMDKNGNTLASPYDINFTVIDLTAPIVNNIIPGSGAANVGVNQEIRIRFDEVMNQAETEAAFSLTPTVTGDFSWAENTLVFTPIGGYTEQQLYTVVLSTVAIDKSGNALASPYSFSFMIGDFTGPIVAVHTPSMNASQVAVNQAVSLTFDELMNQTVTENSFSISPFVAGDFAWAGNTLTFTPSIPYTEQQQYTVNLSANATDVNENTISAPYSFSFTVGDFTAPNVSRVTPIAGSENVGLNQRISLVFDEVMNQTATQNAFGISPDITGSISWTANTMNFTPSVPYLEQERYTVTLSKAALDNTGNALEVSYSFSFTIGDFTEPTVSGSSPLADANQVAVNQVVSLTFSEPMNQSVTQAAFSISPAVVGNFVWSSNTLAFTPSENYLEQTQYTVTISTVASDVSGNALASSYGLTFTVGDFTGPTVSSSIPAKNASQVVLNQAVSLTFNEAMNQSVTQTAFSLSPATAGSFSWIGNTLAFTPSENYLEQTQYTVTVSTAASDDNDNALASPYDLTFTVGDFTAPIISNSTPAENANQVALNQAVSLTFNETMNQSVTQTAFRIFPAVAGNFAWTSNVLTFTPSENYHEQTQYTVTVSTMASDDSDNALASPYDLTFTAGDFTGPTVSSSTPAENANQVALNQAVSLTFNETMNQSVTQAAFSLSPATAGSLAWTGNILTFTPSENYLEQAQYTVTISTAASDDSGNALASPYDLTFTAGDFTGPTVSNSTPAENANQVALNQAVSLTFNEAMNQSVTQAAFRLLPAAAGSFAWAGNTLIFTPSENYLEQQLYTVEINITATDWLGNALASPYRSTFTAGDFSAPTVINSVPAENASEVVLNQTVNLTFNEAMNQSATQAAFSLLPVVAGDFSWLNNTLIFTPTVGYVEKQRYTVTLSTAALDVSNNALAFPFSFDFTVGDFTSPTEISHSPQGTGLAKNTTISVFFDEAIDPLSVNRSSFAVSDGIDDVPGSYTVIGGDTEGVIIFRPSNDLASTTVYSIVVGTNVSDLAGNNLASPINWSFTTGDFIGPEILTTGPIDGAINIALNQNIVIEFNEVMDTVSTQSAFEISPAIAGGIISSGNTLTFSPSSAYEEQTVYRITVRGSATDVSNNLMGDDFSFSFTSGDFTAPTVSHSTPVENDNQVALSQAVSLTFNEAMNQSATQAAFSITPTITGTLGWVGNTLTFTPSENYIEQQQYTVVISTAAMDESDNALASPYNLTFTVGDFTGPTVSSSTPAENANQVSLNQAVSLTFNEAMNQSITQAAFSILPVIAGSFTWAGNTLIFTPSENYLEQTQYTVTVSTVAGDDSDNALVSPYNLTFTAGDFTSPIVSNNTPAENADQVSVNQAVSLTFNEAMNQSVTQAAFSLSPPVAGSFTWVGNTLIFTPSDNYTEQQQYTVAISTAAMDESDNALASLYHLTFTVGDFTNPAVTSNIPAVDASQVAVNQAVSLTFNEAMSQTITKNAFSIIPPVAGNFSWAGNTLTFATSENYTEQTQYTVEISTAAMDENGNALASPYVFNFTVGDFTKPSISNSTPPENASQVVMNQVVSLTFSEAMSQIVTENAFSITPSVAGSLVWTGNTLTFTPSENYTEQQEYTVAISTAATDDSDNALASLYNLTFTVGDFTGPIVSSSTPTENENQVVLNQAVSLVFNEAMNQNVTQTAFSLSPATAGNFSWTGNTLIFTPSENYLEQTQYTVTVNTTASDDNDNALASPYELTFTAGDFTAPNVDSVNPTAGSENVSLTQGISVVFDEAMNQTITQNALTILPNITGDFIWTGNGDALLFVPSVDYTEQQQYTVTLGTASADVNGNMLISPYNFSFTVGDFTNPTVSGNTPVDNASQVAVNQTVSLSFSEPMDQATTQSALSLSPNVAGGFSWSGNTLIFTPSVNFSEQQQYTATLDTVASDSKGNTLSSPYSFNFTVGDFTAPTVSSNTPAVDAVQVAVNQSVSIGFDEPMDQVASQNAFSLNPNVAGNFTWSGNILTFTPSDVYAEGEVYTVTVNTTAKDSNNNSLSSPYSFNFTVGDFTAPNVSSVTPTTGTQNVSLTQNLSVVFDEAMSQTVTQGAFSISPNVDGSMSWTANILTFTPSVDYVEQQQYTVTISTAASDNSGNTLGTPYSFMFTVGDFTLPTVSDNTPLASATQVVLSQTVSLTFSEAMNEAVTQAAFSILPEVAGSMSWSGNTLIFTPTASYTEQQQYAVTLATAARDAKGNNLASPYGFSFTAGDFTAPNVTGVAPTTGSSNIALTQSLSVVFDEAMNQTETQSAFSLSPVVTGNMSWSGNTLIFTPSVNYAEEQEYTVTISTAASDSAGNTLVSPYNFTFTVGDFTGPIVNSSTPLADATNVAKNQVLTFTFNEAMNQPATEAAFSLLPAVDGTMTWTGNTLSFSPNNPYVEQQQYAVTLSVAATDSNGNALNTPYTFDFTVGDFTGPLVSSTTPVNNATGVAANQMVNITFDEAMNPVATEAALSFSPPTSGAWAWVGNIATFTPDSHYTEQQSYTVTVDALAEDDRGNAMLSPYSFEFTVGDFTAPTLMSASRSPVPNAVDIVRNAVISMAFSETMDETSTQDALTISPTVIGTKALVDNILTFTPAEDMLSETLYTVTLAINAKDANDNVIQPSANLSWSFTVEDYTFPSVDATEPAANVVINSVTATPDIRVSFSEPVNTASFDTSEFTLTLAGNILATSIAATTSTSVDYTVTNGWEANGLYQAEFLKTLIDNASNAQAVDIQWAFITDSLTVGPSTEAGGQVFSAEGIDSTADHYYVVTGLDETKRYAIKLIGIDVGVDLNLSLHTGTFSSLNMTCVSGYVSLVADYTDEHCTTMPNSAGEIYVKINNLSASATSFDLNIETVTESGSEVSQSTYDYTGFSGLSIGDSYTVTLDSFTEDLDLYVFDGTTVLNPVCRAVTLSSTDPEFCVFTAVSSDVKILIDGTKTTGSAASYSLSIIAN